MLLCWFSINPSDQIRLDIEYADWYNYDLGAGDLHSYQDEMVFKNLSKVIEYFESTLCDKNAHLMFKIRALVLDKMFSKLLKI